MKNVWTRAANSENKLIKRIKSKTLFLSCIYLNSKIAQVSLKRLLFSERRIRSDLRFFKIIIISEVTRNRWNGRRWAQKPTAAKYVCTINTYLSFGCFVSSMCIILLTFLLKALLNTIQLYSSSEKSENIFMLCLMALLFMYYITRYVPISFFLNLIVAFFSLNFYCDPNGIECVFNSSTQGTDYIPLFFTEERCHSWMCTKNNFLNLPLYFILQTKSTIFPTFSLSLKKTTLQ